MSTSRLLRGLAALAVPLCLGLAAPARALDTLHTTGWIAPPPEDFTLHRTAHADLRPSGVGGFTGTWDGVDIFFWCFDLDQFFTFGSNYHEYVETPYTGPQLDDLQRLFEVGYHDAVLDPLHSAAFQLAIWNIEYDSDATVTSGTFFADHGAPAINAAATLAQADTWLTHLHDAGVDGSAWTITEFTSREHQDFIMGARTAREVPEPSAVALLLAGLLAAACVPRLRRLDDQGR